MLRRPDAIEVGNGALVLTDVLSTKGVRTGHVLRGFGGFRQLQLLTGALTVVPLARAIATERGVECEWDARS